MANFTVVEVIDGDTFRVSPGWKSGFQTGNVVRPTGFDTPEMGQYNYSVATQKLKNLIQGQSVVLGPAVNFDHGRIVCTVYVNGRNLADYFPEYQ